MNSELRESLHRLLSLAEKAHRGARLSLRDKATLQRCRWMREDYLRWLERSQAMLKTAWEAYDDPAASPEARDEARDAVEQALAYRRNPNAW